MQYARAIFALKGTRQAKINNLDSKIVLLAQKNILDLKVTVSDTLRVDVLNAIEHLGEKVFANWLAEGTRRNVTQKFTASDQLLRNVCHISYLSTRFFEDSLLLEAVYTHETVMN